MATFNFKQGDSAPALETTLRDDDGNPIDLSDANSVTLYVDGGGDNPSLIVNDTATISDAQSGEIKYEWGNQLGSEPENYRLEYVIDWNDGDTQTIPDRGFETLVISDTTARNIGLANVDDPDASITTLFVDEIDANSGTEINVNATVDMQGNDIQTAGAVDADSASISGQTTTGSLDTEQLNNGVLFASEFATSGSGTQADPYVDGVRRAVEATNEPHYVVVDGTFEEDPINMLDGAFKQHREGVAAWCPPPLVGFGKRQSIIILKDGSDDHMIKYDIDDATPNITENVGDATLMNLGLIGNKNGQSATSHGIYGAVGSGGERIVRGWFKNLLVRWCNGDGIAKSGDCFSESTTINLDAKYQEGTAWQLFEGATAIGAVVDDSNRGMNMANRTNWFGGRAQFHDGRAVTCNGGKIDGVQFNDNNKEAVGDATVEIPGVATGTVVTGCRFENTGAPQLVNDDGTETRFENYTIKNGPSTIINNGGATRSIVNGTSTNAGDPSTTGQWSGAGVEGVTVRDTTNSNTYIYNNGVWSQIASS